MKIFGDSQSIIISKASAHIFIEVTMRLFSNYERHLVITYSILKSRDITLPTKVCLVKAMAFPVVIYGYESWTVKKAECQNLMSLNYGVGEDS